MSTGTQQRIARNALVRSGGEIVAKVASLLFFVTMARELGREGFGAFMFALGLTTALLVGAGFGTDELTSREVAHGSPRARVTAVRSTNVVGTTRIGVAARDAAAINERSMRPLLSPCEREHELPMGMAK